MNSLREIIYMYTAVTYNNGPQSGGERRFLELLYGLLENGYKVMLFITKEAIIIPHQYLTRINIKKYNSRYLPNGLLNLLANYAIFNKYTASKIEYFIVFSIPYAIQLVLVGYKNIVLFLRDDFINYRKIRYKNTNRIFAAVKIWFLKKIEGYVLSKVENIIVQSEYDKEIYIGRHKKIEGLVRKKVKVLPNNVNPSWLKNQSTNYTKQPQKVEKIKNLLFIGNLHDERKGLHLLLAAMELLYLDDYDLILNIIGDGYLRDSYQIRYADYTNIKFLGHINDPIPYLINSDLLIVPSLADSFPNTILEALFFEIPVIGAKSGGIPEILKYDALLFDTNAVSIYNKLKQVIDGNKLLELNAMCKNRREELSFNWSRTALDTFWGHS